MAGYCSRAGCWKNRSKIALDIETVCNGERSDVNAEHSAQLADRAVTIAKLKEVHALTHPAEQRTPRRSSVDAIDAGDALLASLVDEDEEVD